MSASDRNRLIIMLALVPALFLGACTRSSDPGETIHARSPAQALDKPKISVFIGPTPIPRGDATGARDITVSNQYFALAFGVDTASPWGVAKGGILDIAIMRNGTPGNDFTSLVDFMPNYWSAWPTTYQRVELEQSTRHEVVIRTRRDWGRVEVDTRFGVRADSNIVSIQTRMTNRGPSAVANLTTGYIAWPDGGQLFGMPGLTEGDATPISEQPALANWSASYNQDWALGLHTPFSEWVAYTGRDRYLRHTLAAGESREFEARLQIEDSADLSRFVQNEIDTDKLAFGRVSGRISNDRGQIIDKAAAVIRSKGSLYAWALSTDGRFNAALPVGEYNIYAVAANHAPGAYRQLNVTEGANIELDLSDLQAPGTVEFSIVDQASNQPLDAMISIARGYKPVIKHFGKSRFFTELGSKGQIAISIAPGAYRFDISAAGGFAAQIQSAELSVTSTENMELTVPIEILADPAEQHWYSADLHHHSDVLDGFTEPEFVLRSQLAAGVDIAFLSDHDSIINNAEMARLATTRDLVFIGGTELSASWAHFNAYPIDSDKTVNPEVGRLSVQEIFAEGRRLGAEVISVNHPYGNYGYFDSLQQETGGDAGPGSLVPGGYDPGFDLIEITREHVPQTLRRAWGLWNQGKPAYFAAGSDVHDVWSVAHEDASGSARSYVHVPGELTVDKYVAALKAGHAYASQGPIIFPEIMFGTELPHATGDELVLNYQLQAVAGLESVTLIEQGKERQSLSFATDITQQTPASFTVRPEQDTWFSLVVADQQGNYAYSNPLWVKTK